MRAPLLLLRLVCALLALSISSLPADAAKILKRGNGAEPYSLDPHRAVMTAENNIIGDMLIGLYTENIDGHPVLGAAESADISRNGLTWTFKIRKHTWSDGTPVTAADFVYAYQRVLAPETAAEYASVLYPIKNALAYNKGEVKKEKLGVAAPDPSTLVITLEHAAPYLPELLTHYTAFPVPKTVVEKYGSEWTRPDKMVVNGPYKLKEWRPHDHVLLTRNPKFYDAANVEVDQVYFYPTEDDNTALKRFRAGELDTQERWPTTAQSWLQNHATGEAHHIPQLSTVFISFNLKRKPFDDIRVRRALSMAIDADVLAEKIYKGAYGQAAYSFLPPGTVNVDNASMASWAGQPIDIRREEARKLLAQAGFNEQHPLQFTYRFISIQDIKKGAVAMQEMWQRIGVKVDLQASESKVHWNLMEVHDFQVGYNAWSMDYNDAKNFFFQFQAAAEQMNSSLYDSKEFERLLAQADSEPDNVARGKILGQAQARMLVDLPAMPLLFPFQRHLVKSYVLNWNDNAHNVNRTRWVDIGDKSKEVPDSEKSPDEPGGFWSWFSVDAWSMWWNS